MKPVAERIRSFLERSGWVSQADRVEFLAAGEYNENYLVVSGGLRYVFRINHGSQLGLENQIEYEFHVLKSVEASGVTPKAFHFDPIPRELDGGVLLMEYIEGNPFEYRRDGGKAAFVFSRVHALPADKRLVVQSDPVRDIAEESLVLLNRYGDHPLQGEKARLLGYHDRVLRMGEETRRLFENETLCIVNTEVNSGNFIVNGERAWLVDWEKAVVSLRYQDLGHFLAPTTTLWKTSHTYSKGEKRDFLSRYSRLLGLEADLEEIVSKTEILEKTILLRALSWCFMAYYEYTRMERTIKNRDTFEKIKGYLDGIEWLLK